MNGSIPDIEPKGTRAGDFTSVSYTDADPDCWWTWDKCTEPKVSGLPDDITRCDEPNTWGFTLDDGPNCERCDGVAALNALLTSSRQARTTRFVLHGEIWWLVKLTLACSVL